MKSEVAAAESGFQKLAQEAESHRRPGADAARRSRETLPAAQPSTAPAPAQTVPGELTPAEASAQMKLDLGSSTVAADKPV